METRAIGNLVVSIVGFGCNNFGVRLDNRQTASVVRAALDSGVNFFDTADIYGNGLSEEYLGRALAGRRGEVIIATKFAWKLTDEDTGGASARWIARAVEDSLRRLGTDYIDLYQLHTPDDEIPIAETLGALHELIVAGKVREIGCSNLSVEQLEGAQASAAKEELSRFASVQNHYSLLHREPEEGVLQTCARFDLAFVPYWPLAGGMLTGKYHRGKAPPKEARLATLERASRFLNNRNAEIVEELRLFCAERDRKLLDLAISWLISQPVVASVIAGATDPEQVRSNAKAGGWKLTAGDLIEIDRITRAAHGGQLPRIGT